MKRQTICHTGDDVRSNSASRSFPQRFSNEFQSPVSLKARPCQVFFLIFFERGNNTFFLLWSETFNLEAIKHTIAQLDTLEVLLIESYLVWYDQELNVVVNAGKL